jgi:phosphoribosylanthranilate isomerase
MPVRVKICGITRSDDACTAARLGADALGFNFFAKSPRYITPEAARQIIRKLPPFVSRVGVFVDETAEQIRETIRISGIDTIQLHGNESPEFCREFGIPVIKALGVKGDSDLALLDAYEVSGFLLDTWHQSMHGGTGQTFDWRIARRASEKYGNVILAGGLGPTNLDEALGAVNPFAVDLNSGVEIMPGVKNPHKMRDAIRIVRHWKSE